MIKRNFATCHSHPQSLDSASTPEAFAKREVELDTGVITVTDHGSLAACRTVYDLAKKHKLIPVLGLEGYFRDDNCDIFYKANIPKNEKGQYVDFFKYGHFCTHFLDQAAYECGVRLISKAPIERHGSETKPLFDWKALEELSQYNVTFTTGCLIGMVQRHLLDNNDPQMAVKYFERLLHIFGKDRLFVEVFPHVCDRNWVKGVFLELQEGDKIVKLKFHDGKKLKTNEGEITAEDLSKIFLRKGNKHQDLCAVKDYNTWNERNPVRILSVRKVEDFIVNECRPWAPDGDVQRGCNEFVMRLSKKYNVPILIADDSHFAHADEKPVQDVRLMASGGSWRFANSYHRQSSQEAYDYFKNKLGVNEKTFEGWVDNSHQWASRFKDFKFVTAPSLPTKFYPEDTLKHTMDLIKKHGRMDWDNERAVARLEEEIQLLHKNGTIDLLSYFFIDEEVCWEYSKRGLLTGPGRGSAAGVRLAYLLSITHADPFDFDLSLERFITMDRIASGALPDIDQDLPNRDLLVSEPDGFLHKRFGDHFAQISVDTTLKLKSAIKDVCRVLEGRVLPEIEQITRELPDPPQGVSDHNFVFGYTDSGNWHPGIIEFNKELQDYTVRFPKHWSVVQKALGLSRQKSRHACLPAGQRVISEKAKLMNIVDCNNQTVFTGQGSGKGIKSNKGLATLLHQGVREVVEYEISNGKTIRCTPDHKVLTVNGWMEIQIAFERKIRLVKSIKKSKLDKSEAENYALRREGRLNNWGGSAVKKSEWICKEKHIWSAPLSRLFNNEQWCKKCSNKTRFVTKGIPTRRHAAKCLNTYQRYDKKKGFVCDLTVDDLMNAKSSKCLYCNRISTGFERIDNNLGHTKNNCIPSCLRCNWMRGKYVSHETMIEVGKTLQRVDP